MNTLYTIIGLFAIGALFGIYLLTLVLQNKKTSTGMALIHGLFVAAALITLIVYSTKNQPSPITSIILFVIAALGGLVLFYRDVTGQTVPKWLAVLHGLLAVTGFILLLVFTFGNQAG
jgi:peptidoglycan/LPS O-acetylase OafA/YrhL